MRLRRETRTWGLVRRTLALGRSSGSLFYLLSVGLIASWIIAVFFGAGLFLLMPRSAKLEPGLSPAGASFDAAPAKAPSLTQSESRLGPVLSQPPPSMADAAPSVNPRQNPAAATIARAADEPPAQALSVVLGTMSATTGEAVRMPAPQSQLSTAREPRNASQSFRSPLPRKPLERRTSKTRTAQPHAAVSAIQDVLHKHSRLLK